MLPLLVAGIVLTCAGLLLGQASPRSSPSITVTITPAKAMLFAGEMQPFVATAVGIDDKSVNWTVERKTAGPLQIQVCIMHQKSRACIT